MPSSQPTTGPDPRVEAQPLTPRPPPLKAPRRGDPLKLLLLACGLLAALWLSARGLSPPDPLPRSAPLDQVSAERAAETLDLLLGDGSPHPVGSERNAQVRDQLVGELRHMGYVPKLQHALSCKRGVCAEIDNVWVRVPGSAPELKSLLLVAHYDSVPAAPGAGDDGLGVASLLELARALKHRPALRRSSVLLFSDGEEAGLLGMRAFADHPIFAELGLCINVESRGNAGPSLLFETAPGDADLVKRFAAAARQPVTSSVFQAVYEKLPNDTDFSVAKQRGLSGLNFATIGGVERYHTAEDSLANLSRQSLQHSLDNLLSAVTALSGDAASDQRASHERATRTYFDLLGSTVLFLPRWAGSAALLAACLTLLSLAVWQRRTLDWRRLVSSGVGVLLGLLACCGVALLLGWLLSASGRLPDLWVAHPLPILFACAGIAATGLLLLSRTAKPQRRRVARGLTGTSDHPPERGELPAATVVSLEHGISVGLLFCGLGLALQGQLPGASYLGFVPALSVSLSCVASGLHARCSAKSRSIAWLVWSWACALSFCTAILWLPILLQLYAAVGLISLAVYSALWYVLGLSLLPLIADKHAGGAGWVFAGTGVAVLLTLAQPAYNSDVPQRASVGVTHDVDARSSQVWVDVSHGPAPRGLTEAFDLGAAARPSFPWFGGWRDTSVVAATDLWRSRPRSTLKVARREVTDAGTLLRLDWRREVWTEAVSLSLASTQPARVNFVSGTQRSDDVAPHSVVSAPQPGASLNQQWKRWVYLGSSKQVLRVELLLPGDSTAGTLGVHVCEHRFDLPNPIKEDVQKHRSDAATASQYGDSTAICRVERL